MIAGASVTTALSLGSTDFQTSVVGQLQKVFLVGLCLNLIERSSRLSQLFKTALSVFVSPTASFDGRCADLSCAIRQRLAPGHLCQSLFCIGPSASRRSNTQRMRAARLTKQRLDSCAEPLPALAGPLRLLRDHVPRSLRPHEAQHAGEPVRLAPAGSSADTPPDALAIHQLYLLPRLCDVARHARSLHQWRGRFSFARFHRSQLGTDPERCLPRLPGMERLHARLRPFLAALHEGRQPIPSVRLRVRPGRLCPLCELEHPLDVPLRQPRTSPFPRLPPAKTSTLTASAVAVAD
jgi:hypothetical protein